MASGTQNMTTDKARILSTSDGTAKLWRSDNTWSNTLTNTLTVKGLVISDQNLFAHINFSRTGAEKPSYINVPASSSLAFSIGGVGSTNIVAAIKGTSLQPWSDLQSSLGTSSERWNTLYTKAISTTHFTTQITGTQTAQVTSSPYQSALWKFNLSRSATSFSTGETIMIKTPGGGGGQGVFISFDNGATYRPICVSGTSKLTTHFTAGVTLILTYDSAGQANSIYGKVDANGILSTTTGTNNVGGGCWRVLNLYDSGNSNDTGTLIRDYGGNVAIVTTTAALYRYELMLSITDTNYGWKVVPINTTSNTQGTGKTTIYAGEFNPFGEIYYYSHTDTVNANTTVRADRIWKTYPVNIKYSFNCGDTLTASKDVYIVATMESATTAKLRNPTATGDNAKATATGVNAGPITQTLPTTNDGFIYIRLGRAYNSNTVDISIDHPIYYHDGTSVRRLSPINTIGTAKGDMIYWSAANIPKRLAIGTAGYFLKSTTDGPAWEQKLPIANGGTGATDAAGARTNLGLGTAATHPDSYFALASHGTHVPTAGTTAQFLRGDNSWSNTLTGGLNLNGTTYINREQHSVGASAQCGIMPLGILGFKNGYPMFTDPEFASGTNSVDVYNNQGNGSIVITRTTMTNGNKSGYVLQIDKSSTVASPDLGGFVQAYTARANAIYVQIFRAKIPVGYKVWNAENPQGANASITWLTDQAGTGKWEWYARLVHCGDSGSFSSGGHVYLSKTSDSASDAVTWYLSYCNCFDVTNGEYDGLRVRYADRITGNLSGASSGSLNIWVSSTGNADGVPNYISRVYFDAATKVMNAGGLNLSPEDLGNYNEGIRIHQSNGGWASIVLCGSDNTGTSGTSTNTWGFYNNNGNFYISRNGSSTGTSLFGCVNNVWRLTTSADMPEDAANISSANAAAHYMTIYRNAILIPYQMDNTNDGGFFRVRGTSESTCICEIGTWDDSGGGETIQFNYYPTTSQATPTYSISVPKASGTLCLTDGTGASGTWGISITGTAGGVTWANVSDKPNICTTDTAQTITGDKSWGSSGAGGILYGNATNGGINSMRIGDDVYLGDCNAAGIMGMKSTSTNCGFYFYNSGGTKLAEFYAVGSQLYTNVEYRSSSANGFRLSYGSYGAILRNDGESFYILFTNSGASATGSWNDLRPLRLQLSTGTCWLQKAYGAVWNDYAEFRSATTTEPGRVIYEQSNGIMALTTERLQPGAKVVSDTYGFAIGQTKQANTPIAVSGRALVYPYRDKSLYELGAAVCSAPNGTVDIMTREEIMKYPERIVGTVSEIPTYTTWKSGLEHAPENVPVKGRIWIYVH